MTETHSTTTSGYGRCAGCDEIKQVTPDGVVQAHNSYRVDGTTVVTFRCPGSDARPADLAPDRFDV